eukprot:Sspe_Gene.99641::Locus_73345_Transcript_1_1_Confidence_1.000_Length_672::g.99641::m.99641
MDSAVAFLVHPDVRGAPCQRKMDFLTGKKMDKEAIIAAARTAGDRELLRYLGVVEQRCAEHASPAAVAAVVALLTMEGTEEPVRRYTLEELSQYDGHRKRAMLSCMGNVYEVDPTFYGKGATYNPFAGKECSRHLAKLVIGDEEANCKWEGLTEKEAKVLADWNDKYQKKYPRRGWVDPADLRDAPSSPKMGKSSCTHQ